MNLPLVIEDINGEYNQLKASGDKLYEADADGIKITSDALTPNPVSISFNSIGFIQDDGVNPPVSQTWDGLNIKIAALNAITNNNGNGTQLVVNKTLTLVETDPPSIGDRSAVYSAGDPSVVGEQFGLSYFGDVPYTITESGSSQGLVINPTTTHTSNVVLVDDLTTPTTTNTIQPTSVAFNTTSGEVIGSYTGNSFSLQYDGAGSSIGTAGINAGAINSSGTLISSLGGGIANIPTPPYPASDANWSLSVNSSTRNPTLTFQNSAPFENSTSMTLDLNNLIHNQGTGSPSPDDNFTISTNKNLILTADNVDLSDTGRLILPSLASGNYMDYDTGKLTIVNNSVGGATNPLLVLQNTNTTAGAVVLETYKNDLPTSTGGDTIASWSANCNTNIGKTETSRINHIAYGVGASNNDGGISLDCKVNSTIKSFLICNGGASTGEIQVFKPITTTSPNNIDITCPTAGGFINLTSVSSISLTATGDNLELTAGATLLLDSADLRLANTATATSGVNNTSLLSTGTSIGDITNYLKLKLNGADIWLPYFTLDPS